MKKSILTVFIGIIIGIVIVIIAALIYVKFFMFVPDKDGMINNIDQEVDFKDI